MAQIKDLEKYIDYEFSSGCYTGDDYKSFQTKYINFLRSMCKQNHWQLVNIGRNHYCFSAFIKSAENKCVYVSITAYIFIDCSESVFDNEFVFRVLLHYVVVMVREHSLSIAFNIKSFEIRCKTISEESNRTDGKHQEQYTYDYGNRLANIHLLFHAPPLIRTKALNRKAIRFERRIPYEC